MKNGKVILLVSACMILLSGCGNTSADGEKSSNVVSVIETEISNNSDIKEPDNSEKLYEGHIDDDGLYRITRYKGSEKEIIVPKELEGKPVGHIGTEAFADCDCTSVILPDTVETIGKFAFKKCSLESISMGKGLKSMGEYAFFYCPNLTRLDFPKGMEKFEGVAIGWCKKLKEIYIPETIVFDKKIGFISGYDDIVIYTPANTENDKLLREWGFDVKNE